MKRYSEGFKAEAVKLALEGEVSKSQVARDLGVNINSLAKWIRQYEEDYGSSAGQEERNT